MITWEQQLELNRLLERAIDAKERLTNAQTNMNIAMQGYIKFVTSITEEEKK